MKKYQYIFYKSALLHGLNVSVAVLKNNPDALAADALVAQLFFRTYWLSLNASYVLEFFLQTLVKRKVLKQNHMLVLNQILMVVSTSAAIPVLVNDVCVPVASTLLLLNFVNRKQEMANVAVAAFVNFAWRLWQPVE